MTVTKRQALAAARRATQNAGDSLDKRDDAIRAAAEFASLREIAEAVGLSKPRVHQIVGTRK